MTVFQRKRVTSIPAIEERKRLVDIGRIRLGFKAKKGDKEYPVELPFFLLPDDLAKRYGGKVTVQRAKDLGVTRKDVLTFIENNIWRLAEELPVMLPINDIATVFPYSYVWFGQGRGVKCEGNGEVAHRKQEDGSWKEMTCKCEKLTPPEGKKAECSHCGVLSFMAYEVHPGGVYKVTTRGYHSIVDILSGIEAMCYLISKKPAADGGVFAQIPMILRRMPRVTHHDDQKQLHFTLKLIPDAPLAEINRFRENQNLIIERSARLQIPHQEMTNPEEDEPDVVDVEIVDEEDGLTNSPRNTNKDAAPPKEETTEGTENAATDKITQEYKDAITDLRKDTNLETKADTLKVLSFLANRNIESPDELTKTEASNVCDFLLMAKNGDENAIKTIAEAKGGGE